MQGQNGGRFRADRQSVSPVPLCVQWLGLVSGGSCRIESNHVSSVELRLRRQRDGGPPVCVLDREVESASGQNFAKPRHRAGQSQTGITAAVAEKEQDREPGIRCDQDQDSKLPGPRRCAGANKVVCPSRGTLVRVRKNNLWRLQSCSVVRWLLVGAGMAQADGFLPCRASRGPAPWGKTRIWRAMSCEGAQSIAAGTYLRRQILVRAGSSTVGRPRAFGPVRARAQGLTLAKRPVRLVADGGARSRFQRSKPLLAGLGGGGHAPSCAIEMRCERALAASGWVASLTARNLLQVALLVNC